MNYKHCNRGSQNRYPHWNHFLTALFVAVMVMISTVPAFAVEATANTSEPDAEISISTLDLAENPADENGSFTDETGDSEVTPEPPSGPALTIEELLDAIAHANANDVIEFDGYIQAPSSDVVLGRADCPITLRRATSEAHIYLWDRGEGKGNTKVQNITFDGAGIQAEQPILNVEGPAKIIEKCNFVNCIAVGSPALSVGYGDALISDCHFTNNIGATGAHLYVGGHDITIENCTFTGGFARNMGSVYIGITENVFLKGCTISGNAAGKRSGGLYIQDGEVIIIGCKIYGNTTNGVADDITKSYNSRLSLMDNHSTLVELYKPDGMIPNRWTVDSYYDVYSGMGLYQADMIFSMTFADNEPSPPPSPTYITLDKSELTLYVGETDTLTATIHPEGTSGNVQWTSNDPSVASVTEMGFITAHTAGTTLVTATETISGASASCRVSVQDVPATTYSVDTNTSPVEGGVVNGGGQYEEGSPATVTAVPNEGFRFLAWTENDTQISTESSLTFTVTSNRNLTAIFEPITEPTPGPILKPTYIISTSVAAGGTVNGAGEYEQGSSVTLTATPESRYRFIAWIENNERISSDESYTFIADCDRTIIAYFMPTCTISVGATVGGTISTGTTAEGTSGGCGGEFLKGSSVTYTAIPDSGYLFAGWTENGEQVSVDESITFVVDRDRTLVANFTPIPKPFYTINVSATIGGTVSGGGEYEQGNSVTLIATPGNDYLFMGWTENGEQVSTDENFTFIAEQDRTLVANFTLIPKPTYTIHVSATQGGTVEGGGQYEEGKLITVNAVPDNSYRFLRWEENGVQVSTEVRYSFAAEADRTLAAIFDLIPQSTSNLPYSPSHSSGTPTTSHKPNDDSATQPNVTVMSYEEVQTHTLTNGKATLVAPDNLFWGGYKTGRDNGAETVTRADLAQLIYFMMDSKSVKTYGVTQAPFRDVESGTWYAAAVGTMQNTGVMVGCGDDLFCPNRTLTWGELLTVFARFVEGEPPIEYYTGNHWAKDSINKAFALGWLEYTEPFDPGSVVTTGEMVDLIQAVFRWNNG